MLSVLEAIELNQIEKAVRYGEDPENPGLLRKYLSLICDKAQRTNSLKSKQSWLLRGINTLLETMCDACITQHWRMQCLDNLYQPLLFLQRLANNESDHRQVNRLKREINTLGHYFLTL